MTTTQSPSLASLTNYSTLHGYSLSCLASKCDDISCSEVIRALRLEDDPVLEAIEAEIDECKEEMSEWRDKKEDAETNAKGMIHCLPSYASHDVLPL